MEVVERSREGAPVDCPGIESPRSVFAASENVRIGVIVDGIDEARRELRTELLSVEEKAQVIDIVVGDAVNAGGYAESAVRCSREYRVLTDKVGLCGDAAEPKN